jgi:hypothetical protein
MRKSLYILLISLILLTGVLTIISCTDAVDKGFDIVDISSDGEGDDDGDDGDSGETKLPLPTVEGLLASGSYSSGISVTVPDETEYGDLRCESNGKVPEVSSTITSGSTLSISRNTVLRCAYFKDGERTSRHILRTYIVERLPSLPIVSIAVDPDSMFNRSGFALYRSGLPGNSGCPSGQYNFYTEREIPIQVDFFESGAEHKWSYPAGIKIHGGCSRNYAKKSVIVSFRNDYGQKNLEYPLFPSHPNLTKFKHFMLRNNGNNYENDYIRDMLMTSLTEGLDLDYQKGRAVVVYYNGAYYGIHNLRERANNDFFETNYGINDKYVDLIDAHGEPSQGSDADYQRDVVNWLEGIATLTDGNLETLKERIDVNNYTNHFQSRIFYIDGDWPGNNIKRWRYKNSSNPNLRKWKFFLYDTDHGFGSWGISDNSICSDLVYCGTNMMRHVTGLKIHGWSNPTYSTLILRKLLTNESYKYAFINRFSLLIATYFTTGKINARINELMTPINGEIQYDQQRWGHEASTGEWVRGLSTIRSFGSARPALMQKEIEDFFSGTTANFGLGKSLGASVDLTLTVSGSGNILVHDLPLPSFANKTVTFKAYPEVPITLRAEGAGFRGWKVNGIGDGNANPKTFTITGETTITAEF